MANMVPWFDWLSWFYGFTPLCGAREHFLSAQRMQESHKKDESNGIGSMIRHEGLYCFHPFVFIELIKPVGRVGSAEPTERFSLTA
jgi:hypothetical protein